MSHTTTCERDGHHDNGPAASPHSVPSILDPSPSAIGARAARTGSFVALPEVRWAAIALVTFALGVVLRGLDAPEAVTVILLAGCYAAGGWEPALAGLQALRERTLDVDLLMIVAALAAAAIGQAFDGALLIVIFATSGALEALATKRTQDAVRLLLDLAPDRATRVRPDGSEEHIDAALLIPGDVVLVRPGERIAADGRVVDGMSEVDQATITGEPLPAPKRTGDEVFAGTMNGTGVLHVQVDRSSDETVMARIVALVEDASATKARRQLFIETVEQRYSLVVVTATLALIAVPLAAGSAFQPSLLRAMTFMIVASPCAVVLATMPPLLSAIANAGRHGVLVKSAIAMERLADTTVVAFDKTGTLTTGAPTVTDVHPFDGRDRDDVLLLAAAVEAGSEHPIGRAIVAAARRRGLVPPAASGFVSKPGRGVTAVVGHAEVAVTRPELPFHDGADPAVATVVAELEARGRTAVVVTVASLPAAVIGLADQPRSDAAAATAAITALTGRSPVLLTGDNHGAARSTADEVGVADIHAELLPADKVARVHELAVAGHATVVGDGVNDGPMLAAAGTGIAMGGTGSDLALDTADVVLVSDNLAAIPAVIALSQRARRVIIQNLTFAATVIAVLVVIDLAGRLPLPLGVAGHETSTVIVGLNGLRLLSPRSWRPPQPPAPPGTAA